MWHAMIDKDAALILKFMTDTRLGVKSSNRPELANSSELTSREYSNESNGTGKTMEQGASPSSPRILRAQSDRVLKYGALRGHLPLQHQPLRVFVNLLKTMPLFCGCW